MRIRQSVLSLVLAGQATGLATAVQAGCKATRDWPGWNGIKYAFVLYVLTALTSVDLPVSKLTYG